MKTWKCSKCGKRYPPTSPIPLCPNCVPHEPAEVLPFSEPVTDVLAPELWAAIHAMRGTAIPPETETDFLAYQGIE